MKDRDAKEGDEVIVVACCSRGPVAVLATRRSEWLCGGCRSFGTDVRTITLGPGGAIPAVAEALSESLATRWADEQAVA